MYCVNDHRGDAFSKQVIRVWRTVSRNHLDWARCATRIPLV